MKNIVTNVIINVIKIFSKLTKNYLWKKVGNMVLPIIIECYYRETSRLYFCDLPTELGKILIHDFEPRDCKVFKLYVGIGGRVIIIERRFREEKYKVRFFFPKSIVNEFLGSIPKKIELLIYGIAKLNKCE